MGPSGLAGALDRFLGGIQRDLGFDSAFVGDASGLIIHGRGSNDPYAAVSSDLLRLRHRLAAFSGERAADFLQLGWQGGRRCYLLEVEVVGEPFALGLLGSTELEAATAHRLATALRKILEPNSGRP